MKGVDVSRIYEGMEGREEEYVCACVLKFTLWGMSN